MSLAAEGGQLCGWLRLRWFGRSGFRDGAIGVIQMCHHVGLVHRWDGTLIPVNLKINATTGKVSRDVIRYISCGGIRGTVVVRWTAGQQVKQAILRQGHDSSQNSSH